MGLDRLGVLNERLDVRTRNFLAPSRLALLEFNNTYLPERVNTQSHTEKLHCSLFHGRRVRGKGRSIQNLARKSA
jgi:hypothetical protein